MSKSIYLLTIYSRKKIATILSPSHCGYVDYDLVDNIQPKSHCICTFPRKNGTNRIEKRQTFNTGFSAFDSVNYWYDGDNLKHRCGFFFALKLTLFIWIYRCKVHFDWNFGQYSGTGLRVTVCEVRSLAIFLYNSIFFINEARNWMNNIDKKPDC